MTDKQPVQPADLAFEDVYLGRGWAFPVRWSTRGEAQSADARPPDGAQADGAQPDGAASERSPSGPARRVAVEMAERVEDIRQSIRVILETTLGERVMHPDFGCEAQRYLFASIGPQTKADLARAVEWSLDRWERRIRGVEVRVVESDREVGRLDVEISFYVDTHRMRQSFIYPFYVNQPGGQ